MAVLAACGPSKEGPDTGPDAATTNRDARPAGDGGWRDAADSTVPRDTQADGHEQPGDSGVDAGPPPLQHDYDVVVVGAGTGGFGAAIQAARMGARTALIEETDWVGGQATAAGVSTMDGPEHWGLYDEFITRIREHYQGLGKSIGTCYWNSHTECFEPSVGRQVMTQMLSGEPNLDLFLRMRLLSADTRTVAGRPRLLSITTEDRSTGTRHVFSARVFVEATEYGDLLPLARARYRVGNSTSDALDTSACVQDITYTAIIRKYETVPTGLAITNPPPGYSAAEPLLAAIVAPNGIEWIDENGNWTGHVHEYPVGWRTFVLYRGIPDSAAPGSYDASTPDIYSRTGVNWPNDYDFSVAAIEDPNVRRQVVCEAKLRTIQFLYYMQTVLGKTNWSVADDEGYDGAYNLEENDCPNIPAELKPIERLMPVMPYVREARRVVGLYTLTAGDIRRTSQPGGTLAVKNFPTALAVGIYAVDLHDCRDPSSLESSLESWDDVPDGAVSGAFQIPYGCFVPEDMDGLVPAEKNLSVTRLVNGAIRLQPITMLTGQAAGALAALAVQRQEQPRQVPVIRVQDVLVSSGVRLSRLDFQDVPRNHPFWAGIQIAATREIMTGDGAHSFRPDDTATRAEAAAALARLFGLDTSHPPASPTFADVPATSPYYAAIEALHTAGITGGCGGNPPNYCPGDPETRAALATMIVRGLGIDPATAPSNPLFSDVPPTHWAFPYVQIAASQDLMAACSPGQFCPAQGATRGEMADTARRTLLHLEQ